MTQEPNDYQNSGEKIDLLLKKIAALENMILMGNNVYRKEHPEQIVETALEGETISEKREVVVGEVFGLEMQLTNVGRFPTAIDGIEEILPPGVEMVKSPPHYPIKDSYLNMNKKILKPQQVEKVKFSAKALENGVFTFSPRVLHTDASGVKKLLSLKPVVINVKKVILPNRVSTGFEDLDDLLLGGFPTNTATILKSVSCDETKLLINRFLEKGLKNGETTVYLTIEARKWEKLANEYPDFHIFVCNPQADITEKASQNVVKLKGVESLTEMSIPITTTLRSMTKKENKPRRFCIEVLSDVLLQHRAVQTRRWLMGLTAELKSKDFTTLAFLNSGMHPKEEVEAILDLFEGEMEIYETKLQKYLRIRKMLGESFLETELPLRKDRLTDAGAARSWKYHNY